MTKEGALLDCLAASYRLDLEGPEYKARTKKMRADVELATRCWRGRSSVRGGR